MLIVSTEIVRFQEQSKATAIESYTFIIKGKTPPTHSQHTHSKKGIQPTQKKTSDKVSVMQTFCAHIALGEQLKLHA